MSFSRLSRGTHIFSYTKPHLHRPPFLSRSLVGAVGSTHTVGANENDGRSTWSKMFLFIPGLMTFGLGTWQIFRRQEKIKMLEYRQSRLDMEPLKGNEIISSTGNLDSVEFRRIQCKGVFDEEKSIYIGPRSRSISGVTEIGYYLITPLIPFPGDPESVQSPVLVNRGWVPRSWRDKALCFTSSEDVDEALNNNSSSTTTQEKTQISSWRFLSKKPNVVADHVPVTISIDEVVGVMRDSENPSIFVPENDVEYAQWFYVDVPAIANACGLPEKTLYVEKINEKEDPSRPYPISKELNTLIRCPTMPMNHLNYTLTWYSLSAAVTFMAIIRLKPRKMRR